MAKKIFFIQGGGEGGYEADKALVRSLQENLGKRYDISYPEFETDESAPDFGWLRQINQEIAQTNDDVLIVGHSLGASLFLKYISENAVSKHIKGVFLISTPFWSGDENWKAVLKLREDFAGRLPLEVPFFFYHCTDDESVPVAHFNQYRKQIAHATFREIETGGHQLNNDLVIVARDIRSLER